MKATHRLIPLSERDEWRDALLGIRHAFAHTWEHCYAMHLTTGLETFLYRFENDGMQMVCPVAEREFSGYTDIVKPFGISGFAGNGSCPGFSTYWKEFASDRGYVCGYLGLHPVFDHGHLFDPSEIFRYNTVYIMDLTPPEDQILAKMSATRREQINRGDGAETTLVHDKSLLATFFLEHYEGFLRSRGAPPHYFFSQQTLSYLLSCDNVMLVGAQKSGKIIAANLFAYTNDIGDGLFNVSLPEGRSSSATLLWQAARKLKSLGVPAKNLGGGKSNSGIAKFKQRFGCKELPLRCLKQIYRPDVYRELCAQTNTGPDDMTGFFPAYRQKSPG